MLLLATRDGIPEPFDVGVEDCLAVPDRCAVQQHTKRETQHERKKAASFERWIDLGPDESCRLTMPEQALKVSEQGDLVLERFSAPEVRVGEGRGSEPVVQQHRCAA